MSRSIRDYEKNGVLNSIIAMCSRVRRYEKVEDLKWRTDTPENGQLIIACKHNDFDSWNNIGYFYDGMLFDYEWNWASEFNGYDAWMAMPLPMIWKE